MQPNPNLFSYNLLFMVSLIGVWYFLVIRPKIKDQKDHQKMLDNIKKNDEVVTIGGVHGTVVNVKDKTYVVRVDDATKVEIDKSAVSRLKTN